MSQENVEIVRTLFDMFERREHETVFARALGERTPTGTILSRIVSGAPMKAADPVDRGAHVGPGTALVDAPCRSGDATGNDRFERGEPLDDRKIRRPTS